MPDGLAGVPAHAEAFGGRPAFRRPAGVATLGCGRLCYFCVDLGPR